MTLEAALQIAKNCGYKTLGEAYDNIYLKRINEVSLKATNEVGLILWGLAMLAKGWPTDKMLDHDTHEWFNTFLDKTTIEEYERTNNGKTNSTT